jgi:hypothetical protein
VVTATATDLAGNMAADTSAFTVDTETSVTIDDVDPTTGVITGTGEPGATVVITVDGNEVGTVTVGVDGTWSVRWRRPRRGLHTRSRRRRRTRGQHGDGHHHGDGGGPDGGMMPDGDTWAASRAARSAPRTPRGRELAGGWLGSCSWASRSRRAVAAAEHVPRALTARTQTKTRMRAAPNRAALSVWGLALRALLLLPASPPYSGAVPRPLPLLADLTLASADSPDGDWRVQARDAVTTLEGSRPRWCSPTPSAPAPHARSGTASLSRSRPTT